MSEETQNTISRRSLFKAAGILAGGIGAASILPAYVACVPADPDGGNSGVPGSAPPVKNPPEIKNATSTFHRKVEWRNNPKLCIACGDCTFLCPAGVLELDDDELRSTQAHPENCLGCQICQTECWQGAIEMDVYW